ncbi:MAG: TlpA disulfide reductase family protein [Bacteroidales bacterium]|nr:TlpA disulfide reductase family protein [Bacteroidales bacterium]
MKNYFSYFLLLFTLTVYSCNQKPKNGNPVVQPVVILKDMMAFLSYREKNVMLSEDFTALDPASEIISKEAFLHLLSSGEYLPLRLASEDSSSCYQLYKLSASDNTDIRMTLKSWGSQESALYKLEGTKFPAFNFIDLAGNVYSNETTKGKILVLKCWYIGCTYCVKEMPALNDMVTQYKNRKDILFVSLAFDTKEALSTFLRKKTFTYAIVPDQKDYITHVLKVHMYPTHFIVNQQGMIAKAVNDETALAIALKKEAAK